MEVDHQSTPINVLTGGVRPLVLRLPALLVGCALALTTGCTSARAPASGRVEVTRMRAERRTGAPGGSNAPVAAVGFCVRNGSGQAVRSVLLTYDVKSAEPGREGEWERRACYANVDLEPGTSACLVCDEIAWPEAVRVTSVQGQPEPYAPPRVADERMADDVPVTLRPARSGYGWQQATVLPNVDPESLDQFLTRDEPMVRREQYKFDDVPIHWAGTGSPSDFAG